MLNRAGTTIACALLMLAFTTSAALASGITNSADDLRTGWYPGEAAITPAEVGGGSFGQEWSASVEGQVYAQPLLDKGTLLVATEQNRVYGLDPATGAKQWETTLNGEPWNAAEIKCGDLAPTVGVTGTPVIDPVTNVAYMTHKAYASGDSGPINWYMDAIELSTGHEKAGFPVELSGTAQNDPSLSFEAQAQLQRPGLLLMEGVVYAAFGSDCDDNSYQGWIFGVTESGTTKARWSDETAGNGSGIWQSGAGLTSDGPGTILFSTGNGATPLSPTLGSEPPGTLGESVVRVRVQTDGELKATDFFAPSDAATLAEWDADFASGGVTGLPDAYFGTASLPHLAVAVGKDGYVYLLNRDNLGGIGEGPGGSDQVIQRLGPYGGVWSRPGVWPGEGGWVYIPTASDGTSAGGSAGNLRVYQYGVSGTGAPALSLKGTSSDAFGFSSGAPVITSNGTASGSALVWIEWAPNAWGEGAQLRAYAPVPVEGRPVLLWSAPIGTSAKFATPGVGAGRLYVGTRDGHVLAFGAPVSSPLSGPETAFPPTTIGSSSKETLTLTANEELTVEKLASSSAQFALGTPSPPLPAHLPAGQTISIPVTFSPSAAGPSAATLTATLSAAGGAKPATFSLSGTGQPAGAKLEGSPTVVSFRGSTVGGSISESVTVRNVGGSALEIEGVEAPESPFHAEGMPAIGAKLEPNASITITTRFEPTETGSFEGRLGLRTTGGNLTVPLTGSATSPGRLTITPETVDYGGVPVGAQETRAFTVANTGGSAVTIFESNAPAGGAFAATSALPEETEIAAGEALTETVRFAPHSPGAASDAWVLKVEGSKGVREVSFTGTGLEAGQVPPPALIAPLAGQGLLSFNGTRLSALVSGTRLIATPHWRVPLPLRCPAQAGSCSGTITLRTLGAVRTRAHQRHPVVLVLTRGSFKLAAGQSTTLILHLSSAARALLTREQLLRVSAVLESGVGTGAPLVTISRATLREAAPARHR